MTDQHDPRKDPLEGLTGKDGEPQFSVPTGAAAAPAEVRHALADAPRPCGPGNFVIQWERGRNAGLPLRLYCAEPLCLNEDPPRCTGPRFVPSFPQYDSLDPSDRRQRQPDEVELIQGVKAAAELARRETGVPDRRSDEEIVEHVGTVLERHLRAMRDHGSWGLG